MVPEQVMGAWVRQRIFAEQERLREQLRREREAKVLATLAILRVT